MCVEEQNFSIEFFKMDRLPSSSSGSSSRHVLGSARGGGGSAATTGSAPADPKRDKQAMEAARSMMKEIFPSLESELLNFVTAYEKADSYFTLHALVSGSGQTHSSSSHLNCIAPQVRLSKHVLSTQEKGSFLAISLGTVLIQIKRNFDKFMQMQLRSIEEARAPSR